MQVWFLDSYSSKSHLPTSKIPAFHRWCSRIGFEPVHREPVNCLLPLCSSGSLFAFSVSRLNILVGIQLNLAKASSHIRTKRHCELSAGLGKQHGCETDEKTQEEHKLFPPTSACFAWPDLFFCFLFFSEVIACWLASINAVVCEALRAGPVFRVQMLKWCWNVAIVAKAGSPCLQREHLVLVILFLWCDKLWSPNWLSWSCFDFHIIMMKLWYYSDRRVHRWI